MRRSRRERAAEPQVEVDAEVTERDSNAPLSAWDRVKLARNPDRPHTLAYIDQGSFLGLRALGRGPIVQAVWVYDRGVDIDHHR